MDEEVLFHTPYHALGFPQPFIYIWRVYVSIVSYTISEVLGVPHIFNVNYIDKAREIDMVWLRDALILEELRDWVFWIMIEGVTYTYCLSNSRR